MSSSSETFNRVSRFLNAYIHPEFRWKIFFIYSTLFVLAVVRVYLRRPFLHVLLNYISKHSGTFSFIRPKRSPNFVLLRVIQFLFTNLFPLLFPFFIASVFQFLRSNPENPDQYY